MTAQILPFQISTNVVATVATTSSWTVTSNAINATVNCSNVNVTFTTTGPTLTWDETFNDWRTLRQVGHALLDGARAARRGDDPAEVALAEWQRRTSR